MEDIKILNKETLVARKYPLQWITYRQRDRNGEMQEKEKEVYFRPDSVTVLLVD